MFSLWSGRFFGMLVYRKLLLTSLKLTIVLADLVRFLAQFCLLMYIVLSTNTILAMVISAFVYGLASSFYLPSTFQLIPRITYAESREQANSVLAILGDIYSIIGPVVGASLVLFLSFETVLLIDSLTFLVAIGLIGALRLTPNDEPIPEQDNKSTLPTSLPTWSINGLKSWFFVSLCLGFLALPGLR
ncbi:hypothetical protein JCM19233_4846 [Vibrio astriarenae]|nr:hypothetical protein JCM19233_4846 [Vibrio sp. C7]